MYKVSCPSTIPKTDKSCSVPSITVISREVPVVSFKNNECSSRFYYITSESKHLPYITITSSKVGTPPHSHITPSDVAFITLHSSKMSSGLLSGSHRPSAMSEINKLPNKRFNESKIQDLPVMIKFRYNSTYYPFFQ